MEAPPTVAPLCRMGVDEILTWAAAGVAMRPATATARMPGCFMKHSPTGRQRLLCAPRRELSIRGMASEKLDGALPNGSRLSCGRNARWRKAVERQKKKLAGEATQIFLTGERPSASSAC